MKRSCHSSRRSFLKQALAVSFGFTGLRASISAKAFSQEQPFGFGPLIPDPDGVLDLPEGFSYQIISSMGEEMSDGLEHVDHV